MEQAALRGFFDKREAPRWRRPGAVALVAAVPLLTAIGALAWLVAQG